MSAPVRSHVDAASRVAVITTTFAHAADVVWTLFADAGRLARWWGPPGMPMVVEHHDLRPGGRVDVVVETPDGPIRGHWSLHTVEPSRGLTFTFWSDGLEPVEIAVSITATSTTASEMTLTVQFSSDARLRHALDIGFVHGVARSCASAVAELAVPAT
jgi:uncharacterized protein YndB with AHSA1/START domain